MSLRIITVLLGFAAAACFSDPGPGLSTGSGASTTGTSQAGDTTAPTTGNTSTGSATGTTAASTTAASTTASDPTSGATTAATTDATTTTGQTTTGPPGTASTTTTAANFDMCGQQESEYECYGCCAGETDAGVYYDGMVECVCTMANACAGTCAATLCDKDGIGPLCYMCIAPQAGGDCFQAAESKCKQSAACSLFLDCLAVAGCYDKP
jgi:hypothetical protein